MEINNWWYSIEKKIINGMLPTSFASFQIKNKLYISGGIQKKNGKSLK